MVCQYCKSEVAQQAAFCKNCGAKAEKLIHQQPASSNVQVAPMMQTTYAPVPKKKKKRVGCLIGIIFLVLVLGVLVWGALSIFAFFQPKDLGVHYNTKDFNNAMEEVGIQIEFDGMTPKELEKYKEKLKKKGTKLSVDDYNWEFSDYQEKTFTLSPSEATALLNEVAPAFWWFEDLQVDVLSDGTMVGSSKADIKRLKEEVYPDIAGDLPIPLPDSANLYGEGVITITDNQLTIDPIKLQVGPFSLPEKYMESDQIEVISPYLERLYTIVPGLEIKSLTADDDGNFVFDGIIPQKVVVTEK